MFGKATDGKVRKMTWEDDLMGRWAKGLRESYATGEMGDTPYWRS